MRSTPVPLLAVLAVGLIGAGCQHDSSYVYVDLNAALAASPPSESHLAPAGVAALPTSSSKFNLPASPAVTEERLSRTGASKVQARITANRERTLKLIVRRLHDAYTREAANLRSQKLIAFAPVRAAIVSRALEDISKAYGTYADAVGPKIAKLAVNAGFPVPGPKGKRKPSGAEGLDTLAYETS